MKNLKKFWSLFLSLAHFDSWYLYLPKMLCPIMHTSFNEKRYWLYGADDSRAGRFLNLFSVVRFSNTACSGTEVTRTHVLTAVCISVHRPGPQRHVLLGEAVPRASRSGQWSLRRRLRCLLHLPHGVWPDQRRELHIRQHGGDRPVLRLHRLPGLNQRTDHPARQQKYSNVKVLLRSQTISVIRVPARSKIGMF